ncbi:hypothetical protein MEX01_40710 [Methylorubrum extorquens]|nr:hypothetical protein MEX01_40710 [Methylorubrum extorquens]
MATDEEAVGAQGAPLQGTAKRFELNLRLRGQRGAVVGEEHREIHCAPVVDPNLAAAWTIDIANLAIVVRMAASRGGEGANNLRGGQICRAADALLSVPIDSGRL